MTKYRNYKKETELIDKLSIVDVCSQLGINVTKKGRESLIQCPNPHHPDKNPSCVLFDDGGLFCRSCGFSKNTYQLIELTIGDHKVCDWAVDKGLIQEQFQDGTESDKKYTYQPKQNITQEKQTPKSTTECYHDIYRYFLDLIKEDIQSNHFLVKVRFLSVLDLKKNLVKPINKDYKEALLRKFHLDDLLKSGLLIQNKDTKQIYFSFYNCNAVFPFIENNKIISLQGRAKSGDYKYINLGGSLRAGIYVPKLSGTKEIYICEGIITALSYIKKGIDAVCIIGTNVARNESLIMQSIKHFKHRRFKLSPDLDAPGYKAVEELKTIFNINNIEYDKNYDNFRELARLTGSPESQVCKLIDYNDFLMFMEKQK